MNLFSIILRAYPDLRPLSVADFIGESGSERSKKQKSGKSWGSFEQFWTFFTSFRGSAIFDPLFWMARGFEALPKNQNRPGSQGQRKACHSCRQPLHPRSHPVMFFFLLGDL